MSTEIAPRRKWAAALLQFLLPGLGNVYCGRPARGIVLHIVVQLAWILCLLVLVWAPFPANLIVPLFGGVVLQVLSISDAVRCARATKPDYRPARYNRWYVYAAIFAGAYLVPSVVLVPPVRAYIFQAFRNPTASMEPTLWAGEHFIADKTVYIFSEPRRGDLVIYRKAGQSVLFAKRIVGMPGDTIEIRNKTVFLNGRKLEEPYVQFLRPLNQDFPGDSLPPTLIPADAYFILGDNRDNSEDSRFSGPIKRKDVLGKARAVYFSQALDVGTIRWNRIGKVLK